jgi:YaiO family outer membrane protein
MFHSFLTQNSSTTAESPPAYMELLRKTCASVKACVFLFCVLGLATGSLGAELDLSELPSAQAQLDHAKASELSKQYGQAVEAYRDYLKLKPQDDEARQSLARLLSWQGQYDDALQLYDEILLRHPGDLDVIAAKARIKSWQKKFADARSLYETVLRENPDDREVKRGLADILYWTGDYANALPAYENLALVDQTAEVAHNIKAIRSELAALTQAQALRAPVGVREAMPTLPLRNYAKLGYTHYGYTNQLPDERDWLIEASKSLGAQTLVGRVEPLHRFGFHDTPVSGEIYSTLWNKAWGYLGGSAAVNPHFAPNVTVGGEVFQGLGVMHPALSFLECSLGYRHMKFKSMNIDVVIPGLVIYLPHDVWITEKMFYVPDTGSATISSEITWRPTDRVQLFFSGAVGTAGERIVAVQDFVRVSTLIMRGGIIFPLSHHLSGEVAGYYEDRETLYVRRGGTFNLIFHW